MGAALVSRLAGSLICLWLIGGHALAQTDGGQARAIAVLSPASGSAEYREIVELVRRPLLRPFGETVHIEPSRVNRIGAFGYVVATVNVAGQPIEEKEWTAGFGACQRSSTRQFAPQIRVLLRSVRGIWQMVEYEVCPPRGEEARWVRRYDTTTRLFGPPDRILP